MSCLREIINSQDAVWTNNKYVQVDVIWRMNVLNYELVLKLIISL